MYNVSLFNYLITLNIYVITHNEKCVIKGTINFSKKNQEILICMQNN